MIDGLFDWSIDRIRKRGEQEEYWSWTAWPARWHHRWGKQWDSRTVCFNPNCLHSFNLKQLIVTVTLLLFCSTLIGNICILNVKTNKPNHLFQNAIGTWCNLQTDLLIQLHPTTNKSTYFWSCLRFVYITNIWRHSKDTGLHGQLLLDT